MEPEDEGRLRRSIERIEAYTRDHSALTQSHHFLHDLRVPADCRAEFVVMGINPGESPQFCDRYSGPTEETSRFDWIEAAGFSRADISWSKRCNFYLDGAPYAMTELFLWSSRNLRELEARLGEPLVRSRHLSFCREVNLELIGAHRPRAVIVVGLSAARFCRDQYGLQHHHTFREGGARIAERYSDGTGRPWLITKHWTGSRAFTSGQRDAIREHVRALA